MRKKGAVPAHMHSIIAGDLFWVSDGQRILLSGAHPDSILDRLSTVSAKRDTTGSTYVLILWMGPILPTSFRQILGRFPCDLTVEYSSQRM